MAASVQHLDLLNASIGTIEARLNRVKASRTETLMQIAAATKRLMTSGQLDMLSLLALYDELNCPGLFTAWKAMGLPHVQRMRAYAAIAERSRPNDAASGGWVGEWNWDDPDGPLTDNYPRDLVPVVYVLYAADCTPIYCGSTEHFKQRLKNHHRDGKSFVAWRAIPCADRQQAYDLEDQLLKQSCPPLNRKAGR